MMEEVEMVHVSGAPRITVPVQDRKRWEADGFRVPPAPKKATERTDDKAKED